MKMRALSWRLALSIGLAAAAMGGAPATRKVDLRPLPASETAVATHAPYDPKDCSACHKNADPGAPGPVTKAGNALCMDCHDDFLKILAGKYSHAAARENCTSCHNPHNAKHPKLLVDDLSALCLACHEDIRNLTQQAAVKHGALTQGAQCANCHNPHGASVEHLLIQKPMLLCLKCHSRDDVVDASGKRLTNFKKLLDENPVQHGPVAAEDCSACHNPHGQQNFRLLNEAYPATFYASYDPKLYALCFECHEEKAFTQPQTDTLTQFRDGSRNLHYVHVNKAERGRTCRACHEVHAARQEHQIRDSVPFGPRGWLLPVNFVKTPAGGSCLKTCHSERSYARGPSNGDKKR